TMINDFFLLVVMAALLFKLDRHLALDTLAILPGILIVTLIFRKYVRDANRRIRTAIARINAFLQEYISGMSVVQLFNRERKALDDFSKHIVAITLGKVVHRLALAVEELHHAHARDVFLKEGVEARDGGADAAIGVANIFAKNQRDDQDARQDGKRVESQAAIELEKQSGHHDEEKEVVDHGDHAGGEKVVEGVDVR